MRLCLDSFVPPLDRITRGTAAWVRDLGFRCIGVDLEAGLSVDIAACRAIRDVLGEHGVQIGQVWSVGTPLVRPAPDEMARHLALLAERIPLAAALGCRVLLVEAGGFHPDNPWFPHPHNQTDEALDLLVRQLEQAAPYAAEHGVVIAPEMSLMTIISSVDRAAALCEALNRPGIGINFDPANITSPATLYRTGVMIQEAFARLGSRIVNAHAKDVVARNVPLIVHLDEAPAGQGMLDYPALLAGMQRLPDWTCLVIEHLADYGQVAEVRGFLERTALDAGVRWNAQDRTKRKRKRDT
jgi:sugar phosphate isomerase/epimerase